MPIKKIIIDKAHRLYQLPPAINSFSPKSKKSNLLKKTNLIDLATFNWQIKMEMDKDLSEKSFLPASPQRIAQLQEEIANWFLTFHGVKLNPYKEIYIGANISRMLLNLSLAYIDKGDIAFVPERGIPLYKTATAISGGQPVEYEISERTNWQPDFNKLNSRLGYVARILFLNNPHNPTGVELSSKDFENLIWVASRENILIVVDAAYQAFSGRKNSSLLSVKNGKVVGIELYSFAYQFGLPSLPFGFAVGNKEIINGLNTLSKINKPFIYDFCIERALKAVRSFPNEEIKSLRNNFSQKKSYLTELQELLSLEKSGFDTIPFVWTKIKKRSRSVNAANILYRRSKILVTPGKALGDCGEGFLRFSLTSPVESYKSACDRVQKKLKFLKLDKEE